MQIFRLRKKIRTYLPINATIRANYFGIKNVSLLSFDKVYFTTTISDYELR